MNETTFEWLDLYNEDKNAGKDLASSVFWRLALHSLPEGVDPYHPAVVLALDDIRSSVAAREARLSP
jgi:hypothetical protein